MNVSRANWLLVGAGAALVVGFFLPWLDLGRVIGMSGWDMVRSGHASTWTKVVLALVPLLGAGLAFAGLGGGKRAANAALVAGGAIVGYTTYKVAYGFFKTTGIGLWLVLTAAAVALIVGLVNRSKK
jgi:hypothetical protein